MDFLKRRPKNVDAQAQSEHDEVDATGMIGENASAQRRQKFALYGTIAVVGLAAMYYVLADDETRQKAAGSPADKTQVSTDALLNRQQVDRDWMTIYDQQLVSQGNKLKGMDRTASRLDQVQGELDTLRQENQQMKADATRVMDAYQRENDQLRHEMESRGQSPGAPGPIAAASALGVVPGRGGGTRSNEARLVSFTGAPANAAPIGDGKKIDAGGKQAAAYTDSPNYLPPNSIAQAKVVVGVDAATTVRSQSDPLPVLLRITGPARSVFAEGRLLRTQVQGCMVNGAAYGDLSSEKVYVKLQRMTCPQTGGRYAVSEVKGFIAFGGKVGLRGRVVSREGGLIGQAFLAGMAGGFGRGFSANANSVFSGASVSVDGKRQELGAGDIVKGGLGEGVSKAGDTVSGYLIERAEQYQPVIEMPTGADVEVVFLDGTFIRN